MKVTILSTYPPERCGVAAYAAQSAAALRAAGHEVRIVTWGDGVGDTHLPHWPRGWKVLDLLPHCAGSDRVILHYMPSFYIDRRNRAAELISRLAMARLFRQVANLEVVVHEQSWYPPQTELSPLGRILWNVERLQWNSAARLCFHNTVAVHTHQERFSTRLANTEVIQHGQDFQPFFLGSRADARADLELDREASVFVSVGFITRYKGYETVIEALATRPDIRCEYHIVGSLHPNAGPDDVAYLEQLTRLAAADRRVRFFSDFIDDISFDRWVRAADAVLLPYRSSTSSSVLARCHLLNTPAIVSRAGGLQAELLPTDVSLDSASEFAEVLESWSRRREPVTGSLPR